MLIKTYDDNGCVEIFDTDLANYEELVETFAETAQLSERLMEAVWAAGLILSNDGRLAIVDVRRTIARLQRDAGRDRGVIVTVSA